MSIDLTFSPKSVVPSSWESFKLHPDNQKAPEKAAKFTFLVCGNTSILPRQKNLMVVKRMERIILEERWKLKAFFTQSDVTGGETYLREDPFSDIRLVPILSSTVSFGLAWKGLIGFLIKPLPYASLNFLTCSISGSKECSILSPIRHEIFMTNVEEFRKKRLFVSESPLQYYPISVVAGSCNYWNRIEKSYIKRSSFTPTANKSIQRYDFSQLPLITRTL